MLRSILFVAFLIASPPLDAQQRVETAPAPPITSLGDEFDGAESLGRWTSHGKAEGWQEMIRTVAVDASGVLRIERVATAPDFVPEERAEWEAQRWVPGPRPARDPR